MLVWTSDCRPELRGPRQARGSPPQSTGCSKSHRITEGCTSTTRRFSSSRTRGYKGQSCGHCRPHLTLCWGPRGAGSPEPSSPRTPTPGGPSAPQGSWEQPPPSAMPVCDATSHPPWSTAPVFSHPQPGCQEQRRPSGPRGSQPSLSPPCPPLPSSGSPQPRPGTARGNIRAQPPSPDSPGSSRVGRHQPPVPGRGERLGGLTGVSASNSGAPELPSGPTAPLRWLVLPPGPACRWFPTAVLLKGVRFHAQHWGPLGPSC